MSYRLKSLVQKTNIPAGPTYNPNQKNYKLLLDEFENSIVKFMSLYVNVTDDISAASDQIKSLY